MNAILGHAQLMERDELMPPHVIDQVRTIKRAGDHLLAIINDILEMSKIEAGRITLNPADFDLHTLLGEVLSFCTERARNKGLALTLTTRAGTPRHLRTDAGKLRQVLLNLVGNAIKFTAAGSITLAVAGDLLPDGRADVRFTVTDTGPGIPPDELGKLFKPFSQTLVGAHTAGGTGLGLAIGKEYARLMDGDITVASTPGVGSTFTVAIRVPLGDATAVPGRKNHPVARRLAPGQRQPRLLVAEDNPLNSDLLKALLLPLGFDVTFVVDGGAATAAASQHPFDAIIMDMQMPVMDGKDATRLIRAGKTNRTTLIIALTASAFEEEKGAVLAAGADLFMRKPFDHDELVATLGERLGLRYEYATPGAAEPDHTPDQFTGLSATTRAAILTAAAAADYDTLCELADTLAPDDAKTLRKFANAYDYDSLRRILATDRP